MPESSPSSGDEVLPTVMPPNNKRSTHVVTPPIDNNNIKDEEVLLLDISSNKEWISYVTYHKNNDGSYLKTRIDLTEKKCTYLTVRKFTEMNRQQEADNEQPNCHFSIDITGLVEDTGQQHCKFLSISPDGIYVALSFYEKNRNMVDQEKFRAARRRNADCLIFKVNDNQIEYDCTRVKFQGRGVFLDREESGTPFDLALINCDTLEVYENFSPSTTKRPTYWFDLSCFHGFKFANMEEYVMVDDSYIKNAPWMCTGNDLICTELELIMTFSRHIQQNVLTTPVSHGVARVWSMTEEGNLLISVTTDRGEHLMAFSKDYESAATYSLSNNVPNLSINIYNAKSGLRDYKLIRQQDSVRSYLVVSDMRFCFGAKYIAMAGIETLIRYKEYKRVQVVFEVWHIETQKSIYYKKIDINTEDIAQHKIIQPFLTRGQKEDHDGRIIKCLKGFYTTLDGSGSGKIITKCAVLDIDEQQEDTSGAEDCVTVDWIEGFPENQVVFELDCRISDSSGLRCGILEIEGKKCLIRFGKHMVQLWQLKDQSASFVDSTKTTTTKTNNTTKKIGKDRLIYIRAYKAPFYGLDHSFRETWMIHDFESIKFIGGIDSGRFIVNITETNNDLHSRSPYYYTEEIILPLKQMLQTTSSYLDATSSYSDTESSSAYPVSSSSDAASSISEEAISSRSAAISTISNPISSSLKATSTSAADVATSLPIFSENIDSHQTTSFDYHRLESACQALHYLHTIKVKLIEKYGDEYEVNLYKSQSVNF
jgi:hypothetical protein